MATRYPTTGGSYVWVGHAFGKHWGFFCVCIQWLANLIWYPTVLSLIAAIFAYLVNPALVHSKLYMIGCSIVMYWAITIMNFFGIRVSSLISALFISIGVLLPILLIMALSVQHVIAGHHTYLHFSMQSVLPHFDSANVGYLIQVVITLIGLEMSAVHAGDVANPRRTFPRALIYSAVIIVILMLGAALAIASIIPSNQISIITGLIDAFKLFFTKLNMSYLTAPLLCLVLIGTLGNVVAWMISSTRGMHIGTTECDFPGLLHCTNRWQAPVSILILEAIIISAVAFLFYLLPTVQQGFWVLLDMASQLALIYYILIFVSAIKLNRKSQASENYFVVPGKSVGLWIWMGLGIITVTTALVLGFVTPASFAGFTLWQYQGLLLGGLLITLCLPYVLLKLNKLR